MSSSNGLLALLWEVPSDSSNLDPLCLTFIPPRNVDSLSCGSTRDFNHNNNNNNNKKRKKKKEEEEEEEERK